jgi:amino acid adenylation domain-containing protein
LTALEKERLLKVAQSVGLPRRRADPPPLVRVERRGRLPLSFAQQRVWFLAQMAGVSEAYHVPSGVRLRGTLDRAALQRALDRIVERHEVLRTRFVVVDGEPEQQIVPAEQSRFVLVEHDLRLADDPAADLESIVVEEAGARFDLAQGPVIRGRLIRLAADEHVLLITMHHIASDGWSMDVLRRELRALYDADVRGEADPLPSLPLQYADYAVWQRSWMSGEVWQRQTAYWSTTLRGAPAVLPMPTDHPRPAEQVYAGGWVPLTLDAMLTAELRTLSKRHGTTLFMTLLAAWAGLLARLSGESDVVIGTPVANRSPMEIEGLIGCFVNTLAIRIDVSGSPTVGTLLARVKAQTLAAQQHQHLPFEQVVEILSPVRSLAHSPLFQVMFAWQTTVDEALPPLSGMDGQPLGVGRPVAAKFDLTLSLGEAGDHITGELEYAASLFERATIERYLEYYRALLRAMVSPEADTVDRLPMLPAAERQQLLNAWNATEAAYPQDTCVHELFEAQVRRTPQATAVECAGATLTYAELNTRANQVAHALRARGVEPDERVAICVERGLDMMVALLGVLKAGGAYVPLDPAYPAERLRFMVEDSAPLVVLTQPQLAHLFADVSDRLAVIELGPASPTWRDQPESDPVRGALTPHHLAYVIYTSGSTGTPKGVAIAHRNTVNLLQWARASFSGDVLARTLSSTSLTFDLAVFECFVPLIVGGTVTIVRDALDLARDPVDVTLINTVPSAAQTLVQLDRVPTTVRVVNVAGEPLSRELVARLFASTPIERVCNLYGPSETTTYSTVLSMDRATWQEVHIGRPIANTRIYIVDGSGEPVPVGVTGELYIGGAGVARGYWNRPALTAERFVRDPFVTDADARMYRTGDLGRWRPDGTIEFLGRNDSQVKIRGFRIELGEIETRLRACAGIDDAAVVAREDTPGEKRLVAYYTSAAGEDVGAQALRTQLAATLPEHMVPSAYVRLTSLPLTPNGKLDRKALPAPGSEAYAARVYEAPVDEVEAAVAAIWTEVLKVERVGRRDNFFALGGHSLLAVTVAAAMRRRGWQVDVRAFFATPTLADLAAAVRTHDDVVAVPDNRIPAGCAEIKPDMLPLIALTPEEIAQIVSGVPGGAANVKDIYPLAPLQEGMLFHHLLEGDRDPYVLSIEYGFDSREHVDRYLHALRTVIARHDVLRTAVIWEGLREPVQVVHRDVDLPVEEVDLNPDGGDGAEQLRRRINPRQCRIDVRQAPMLRISIAHDRLRERWLMVVLRHHLTGDHASGEVMQQEIEACLRGEGEQLPAPLPFRNLVAQARRAASTRQDEACFRALLADIDEPTAPYGLLDVRGDGSSLEQAQLPVDVAIAQRMRVLARKLGVSAASLCHVAWARVVARLSGREDVVFGTALMGRMHGGEGADRVMGMFMNTLPVRIAIGTRGVEETVRQTHTQLADLLRHEHASLALAQRCSSVPAPAPLFSAMLNYRHSVRPAESRPHDVRSPYGIRVLHAEERSSYPVGLAVDDFGDGFGLTAQVDASHQPERLCRYMHQALESLVEALELGPHTAVATLNVLPESERAQLLYGWNAGEAHYPKDTCIHELFEEQVRRRANATAVAYEGVRLRYHELNARANRLAHCLRAHGVGPDQRVGICLERSIEMVIAVLGVLKAGGAYVPLDPAYPQERLRFIVEDSAPVALITKGRLQESESVSLTLGAEVPVIDVSDEADWWDRYPKTNLDRGELAPHHLAYVIYTSGSTGTPKGVMVEHQALTRLLVLHRERFNVRPVSRILQFLSFSFDGCFFELMMALCQGASLHLAPPHSAAGNALLSLLTKERITHAMLPPAALATLPPDAHVKSLDVLMSMGEALSPELAHRWASKCRFFNGYGPTEAAIGATVHQCGPAESGRPPIGRPIANTRIYILDGHGEPVPVGVTGELHIGGVGVARGYWNRPQLTSERFVRDPFVADADARMYRTGDLGRWGSDGTIEFVGRNDFQVKLRGFRIELGEIETRLRACVGVDDAAVMAREDAPGEKRLVAYYTSAAGTDVGAFRMQLSATLPEYMVPSAYVRLASFPLTPSGKLDRQGLPAPGADAYAVRAYETPIGAMETAVAQIWAEVLKVDRVGRYDHFFDLGGHSLLAVQVRVRIREALGVDVALKDLFAHPVLADFTRGLARAARADTPPLVPAPRSGRLPLSFAQQRLWFLVQMEGVSEAYHIPWGMRLRGTLDRAALRRALDRIVERHEVLRTRFVMEDGEPAQQIVSAAESRFALVEHDLRMADEPAGDLQRADLQRLVAEEATARFDLSQGPVIRGRLIRLAADEHVLLITMHHIASDGWSMGVLRSDLRALYGACARGDADSLPPLPVQYADYAVWQRTWMAGDVWEQQAAYWRQVLAGAPALLTLPADHPRPAQQVYAGGLVPLTLDAALTAEVRALSKRHGTTLYMTLLTAWATLLARLSGESEVMIGTPVANRSRVDIEALVGFFVNTLALRIDLSDAPTVATLLARVKAQTLAAQQHQDLPFEQVLEILSPVRSLAHSPVFQVMFAWQTVDETLSPLPGLDAQPLDVASPVASKFDLTLALWEAGDHITGGLEYASSLFERATIERYLEYYRTLLRAMVSREADTVDRLPMLPASERQQLLYARNATVSHPQDSCIHELFEAQVRRTPYATAVEYDGTTLSYAELNAQANQMAHDLRARGVGPDERVAICVHRGLDMVVALLAVVKAGGAYVPLDPAYPAERLRFMVEDSAPIVVVTQGSLAGLVADLAGDVPVIALDTDAPARRHYPTTDLEREMLTPQHLAYVIYTSGSTGTPKGVLVTHANVVRLFAATQQWFDFGAQDVWTLFHSYAFDFSVWELWGALLYGGRLVVVPTSVTRSPEDFYDLVCDRGVTVLNQTPSAFRQLIVAQKRRGTAHQLRHVIFGGEALDVATLRPWYAENADARTRLVNMYGITETTVHVTYRLLEPADTERVGGSPIGERIPDNRIYILDGEGEPVPVGVTGELYVGGAGVARGYWNRPALTAERFLRDPFVDDANARMYRTGDLGRWLPDGTIEFLGRNDFQVKIRGFRIELGEIEARLRGCAGVEDAVVLAREDAPGEKRLVAYYTTAAGDGIDVETFRAQLSAALPEYMVPAAYVRLDVLPLTANGKLDRQALPAPGSVAYAINAYEAPIGEIEHILADVWMDVLGVARVGRRDNFFALGGHSLLVLTLVERLRQKGLQVDVRALFATPALADLAAAVRRDERPFEVPATGIPATGTDAITPAMLPLIALTPEEIDRIVSRVPGGAANVQDIYPLAPLQDGILFHHLLEPDCDPYLLWTQFGFDNREYLHRYIDALRRVMARHDILRTAVVWDGLQEPVQVVLRHVELPVEDVALDPDGGDAADQLHSRVDPRRQRMDVQQAPLMRVFIASDPHDEQWHAIVLHHHLAADHKSLEGIHRETEAYLRGDDATLPEPLPFRNLVAQARLGVSAVEHETYFRGLLGDVDEPTAPLGLMNVRGDGTEGTEAHVAVDDDLSRRIREQARRLGVTVASLWHVACAQVVARLSGRDDVVFGTVLFGRMHSAEDIDRALGVFINTLPMRIRLADRGAEASVREAQIQLADLLRHEHAPLALAQRCSRVPLPLPLFSALVNYRHNESAPTSLKAQPGLQGRRVIRRDARTNYPLLLEVDDWGAGFRLTAHVNEPMDPVRICGYMSRAVGSLVAALECGSSTAVQRLEVLPESERLTVLHGWNATATAYPHDTCVHALFEAQVRRTPEAPAVEFAGTVLTYAEVNARANRLAHYLVERGVGPDARVAICLEPGLDLIVALLAALKAGAGYVPLDPAYPASRLQYMVQDSAPVVLLTEPRLADMFAACRDQMPVIDLGVEAPAWRHYPATNLDRAGLRPDHLVYVLYTSGSTGMPKGVMMPHRAMTNLLVWEIARSGADEAPRTLQFAAIGFDLSFLEIFTTLCGGGTLVLIDRDLKVDPRALYRFITTAGIQRLFLPYSALHLLADATMALDEEARAGTLRTIMTTAEQLRVDAKIAHFIRAHGCTLDNQYGPTETHVVSAHRLEGDPDQWPVLPPIGRPIANTRMYILDDQGGPVPVGVPGELFLAGVQVARGYLNRPALTAERFLRDPFVDEADARMYRTGDLARWLPDGTIEYLGRNDFQVKIRGFRIELGEIEAQLNACPGIAEAVVVAREATGDKQLVAYYTGDSSSEALRAGLSRVLPEYMLPAAYVRLDAWPLTPNGKVDRQALPAPGADAYAAEAYDAPVGEVETTVADIWAEVLSVPRVGRRDHFFALGGHSLLALQVVVRLRDALAVEVPLKELFAQPILADFARMAACATRALLPPLAPVTRGGRLPLSFAQQRLWFLAQLKGGSEAYHIPFGARLTGTLDAIVLRHALQRIVARHEALRTRFVSVDGKPEQQIVPADEHQFVLVDHDLRAVNAATAALSQLVEAEARAPFDLARGPLIRGRLIRVADDEHVLLLTMHHIASDGWSMGLLLAELRALYGAYLRGDADPLPALPVQYADYAVWQRTWMTGEVWQQQVAYWTTTLRGAPAVLPVPADHPRPSQQGYAGAWAPMTLDAALTTELRALSKRHGTTLYMTLLAAWAALLARLSGESDVVVGTPVANRSLVDIEGLIGFFVNTLAIRIDVSGAPTVGTLLARVKAQTLAAQQYQDLPFEQVVESLSPVRSMAHSPIFQVMFAWQTAIETASSLLPGLESGPLGVAPPVLAKFDLTLSLHDVGERIEGGLVYATALFERATIERYLEYYRTLLQAMVSHESGTVDRLPMLPQAERQQLLQAWNATTAAYPQEQCIHELFEAQVQRTPEAPAVVYERSGLTYRALNARANQLAHDLRARGVGPDARVGICLERSLDLVVALLGVLKAGGAYVPLDPSYPVERLRLMVDDSAPVAVLTQESLAGFVTALTHDVPIIALDAETASWRSCPTTDVARGALTSRHLAYVIYTSGSTGTPKGVMNQHQAIVNRLWWGQGVWPLRPGDRILGKTSLGFDGSVRELLWPLMAGAEIVLAGVARDRDPRELIALLRDERIGTLNLVPSLLQALLDDPEIARCTGLVRVLCGGEALPSTLLPRLRERLPQTALHNLYGPSEAATAAVALHCTSREASGPLPIGRPIANTRIYILDSHGEPVPVGVIGELHIGGVGVARGYWNRPELTAERFVRDPFVEDAEARMYRTGDLGRWLSDGAIEFLGRNDFQVKVRGFRIELGEIEARLRAYAGVDDAVVVAREDTPGEKRLVAYYTSASAESPAAEGVGAETFRAQLSTMLPEYMVPSAYVRLESLPLTPSGKLDRHALPEPGADAYAVREYEAPIGDLETAIAAIWAGVLNVERVGRRDHFFDLGGHSLLAVQVMVRLRDALQVEVALKDLFAQPVLAEFARSLDRATSADLPPLVRAARDGRLPLSFAQQRLWFLTQMEGVSEAYHVPYAVRLRGALDRAALRRALDRLVERHEMLRTRFVFVDGEPEQWIVPAEQSRFALMEHDLRADHDAMTSLQRLVTEEASARFDLAQGPVIRGKLIHLADDEHVLLITMHHIASDGWSMGVLRTELRALYGAYSRGDADPLPALTVQYADYAVWQRTWMAGEVWQRQVAYWTATLRGAPAVLALPTDHPRPAQQAYAGAWVPLTLDATLTAELRALSKQYGTTLYMTLLAAWAALLARLSGESDVVIGTLVANRSRVEIEGLIGFFVNTLAIRIDVSGAPTIGALLARVKAQTLAAQQHQDLPFEQVVEILNPVRSLAHSPVFQVTFAWQTAGDGTRPQLPGLDAELLGMGGPIQAKFDQTLSLQDLGDRIEGGLVYATSLFERVTIERHVDYFRTLLRAMVSREADTVDRLPMLSEPERRQLLSAWNATTVPYPREQCMHELFEAQVIRTPQATAVEYEGTTLTYAELNRQANQLAHHLRARGVEPDARVGICLDRSLELVVALLGVLKAGGAYVPLDPSYPEERLRVMVADSAPAALLIQPHLATLFADLHDTLSVIELGSAPPAWSDACDTNPDRGALRADHLAYVIYTSGSTGAPKGVMVEHRSVVNLVRWMQDDDALQSDDVLLQKTPISFDASVTEFFWPLAWGAKVHMARPEGHKDPAYLLDAVRSHGITRLQLVPSMLQLFVEQATRATCQTLRHVQCGGEALSIALVRRFHERLPGVVLQNLYGPTEATVDAVAWSSVRSANEANVPIGRPIANTRIYILDPNGELAPSGTTGELYIGGAGVARGYWNRPALTAERFVRDRFVEDAQARMYRTGDLGRWLPDGTIEFVGRNDFQVKIRGFRIELGEIDTRLRECPGVEDAVVVAREDAPGDTRLVAYYTSGAGEDLAVESLSVALAATLPVYMVPSAYVRMASFPLTPNGKLDRQALPEPGSHAYAGRTYEAPIGTLETTIAEVWADVLKVERIGRWDNFFGLGGHSLLAVQVVERLRQRGIPIDVRALFTTPALADLVAAVGRQERVIQVPENRIAQGCDAITPDMLPLISLTQEEIDRIVSTVPGGAANVKDIYPLAPLQDGMLFHHLLGGDGDPYLLAVSLVFETRDGLDDYVHALRQVIARHDILRTAVAWEGLSQPLQVVHRHADLLVEEVALDPQGSDAAEQLYRLFDPRRYRIDVRQAPMLRVYIAQVPLQERWLMLVLRHHLTGDHAASAVVQAEIEAYLRGEGDTLPEPLPFRNLVVQARFGISLEEHERYFHTLLGDVDEPTAPFGLMDVRADGTTVEQARRVVDADLARRLREQGRTLGVTAASLCHVAWAQVLARIAGRDDVVFGTVLFGRMHGAEHVDRVMGMFINTLPVRIRVGQQDAKASVREIQTQLAELLRHEHASLALAQRCSRVPAPAPLFTSLLNYRHTAIGHAQSAEQLRAWQDVRTHRREARTNYPVVLSVDDWNHDFGLTAQVNGPIDPARICDYMHQALESLVLALERGVETPLRSLPVLPAREREQLLSGWNATDVPRPPDTCVHELVEAHVRHTPDATALVYAQKELTYAELNERANRLAHYLRARGVGPDERVGLCLDRSVEMVVAMLAVLKAGGAYVPLDPEYPEERLRFMVDDSAPVALLADGRTAGFFSELRASVPVIDVRQASAPWEAYPETNPERGELRSNHLAYVIYTSGSTGRPKGVMVEHRNVTNYLLWLHAAYYRDGHTGSLSTLSFTFDASVTTLWGPLTCGQPLTLVPQGRDLDFLRDLTSRAPNPFTLLKITPSHLKLLNRLDFGEGQQAPTRILMLGGEAVIPADVRTWQQRFPDIKVVNHFGPTETTVGCCTFDITTPVTSESVIPIGRPIANARLYILDGHGDLAPVEGIGELHIGGAGVARGYWNRPELTAERFVRNPFVADADARMYRTGDMARWRPDGTIEFLGRNDFQVKIRGFRIELGEIEARLRDCDEVGDVAVLAREDTPGEKRLVAYYTGNTRSEMLRAQLSATLPDYMVPAAYVWLAALPLTPSGKLDRKALPEPGADAYAVREYEAPSGDLETTMAEIWADVLKVDRVGRRDNFFALGGHSLSAITVVERLRRRQLEVDVRAIFATPALADLAATVRARTTAVVVPENRIPSAAPARLSGTVEISV